MAKATPATKPAAAETPANPAAKTAALKKDTGKASTAVAVRPNANMVSVQEQLRAQAAAMAERTAPPSGIKIQVTNRKTFKLPNGQEVNELTACIVDFVATHNFYEGKFDPKNIVPPVCFAIGQNPKDMAPSANSPQQQAQDCQACPMNQFGSDGDGKACKNGRLLALLPPNDAGNDVDAEADIWTISVSPTALKGWDGYVQTLARTFQLPPVGFLTKITFDPSVEHAKLVFSEPAPIASLGEAYARQGEAQEILNAEPDVSKHQVAAGAKGGKAKPAARR